MEGSKAEHRLTLLKSRFPRCTHKVVKHYIVEDIEYIKLEVSCSDDIRIFIREFWKSNELARYGRQSVLGDRSVLRYDNTPHHPEIETFPHHKHLLSNVFPLENSSLEAFIEEVIKIIARYKG